MCINVKTIQVTAGIQGGSSQIVSSFPVTLYGDSSMDADFLWTNINGDSLSLLPILEVETAGWYFLKTTYQSETSQCSAVDSVFVDLYSGSKNIFDDDMLRISSINKNGIYSLSLAEHSKPINSIQVVDIQGITVFSQTELRTNYFLLDIQKEKAGLYVVSVLINGRWLRKKVLKY